MTVKEFLEALAQSPDLAAQFEEVPVFTMVEQRVSEEDRDLILNGSIQEIRDKVAEEANQSDATVYVIKVKMR